MRFEYKPHARLRPGCGACVAHALKRNDHFVFPPSSPILTSRMSAQTLEWILGGVYLLLGPGAWALFGFGMIKGRKRMDLLRKPLPALADLPLVTILIPAKDEGERIRGCLRSALAQDYPQFEVIAVDDRSTDQTGSVMDEMASTDARLRVMHIKEGSLPTGWFGKSFALHNAVPSARGKWFCFVDSDVVLEPDVVSATIAVAEYKRFDLVSLLPRLESGSFWESLLVPLGGAATSAMYLLPFTNYNESKIAFANGQYLCVRRDVYEAVGGHEAVGGMFSEDVQIAKRVKKMGYRPRLSIGTDYAAVRMYSSPTAVFKGWARNFYAGSLGKPWRILAAIAFMLLCCFSAYAAIGWGVWRQVHPVTSVGGMGWLAAGAVHLILMTFFLSLMYRWSGNRPALALLFPLGGGLLLAIFGWSLWLCTRGKVEWRGTTYSRNVRRLA
jgi:glycosyltransferase involved in cell wall biosynthesis